MHTSAQRLSFGVAAVLMSAVVARAQIDVALCGAASSSNTACQWVDVQTRLMQTGLFNSVGIINVTTTGGGTPTLAQLAAYDAVLCYTNVTPADFNSWGDVLADYVDIGGGVVVSVFANSSTTTGRHIGGRWQNGYEVILDQSGSTGGAGGALGNVLLPGHPVMAGVTAFTGGTTGSRPTGTALEVGSFVIAEWNDGKILAAGGAMPNRIDLGFYPPHASCAQAGWATGGDQLMANALLYVATAGSYLPYGAGCQGALGVPELRATPGSRPVPGAAFSATLDSLPLGVGIVAMGFSDQVSAPFSLPFDLGAFGMPGCQLLAEVLGTSLVFSPIPSATWTIALPNSATFLGQRFYNQGFALDGLANPAGLTVSNAAAARIGF